MPSETILKIHVEIGLTSGISESTINLASGHWYKRKAADEATFDGL